MIPESDFDHDFGLSRPRSQYPIRVTPGPFEVSPRVMRAALHALSGHREPEFVALMRASQQLLLRAFEIDTSDYFATILTSTGSGAMEAMVAAVASSRVPVVVSNGRFGQRLADMARVYCHDAHVVEFPSGVPVDVARVARELDRVSGPGALLFCRQDTREGILNPLNDLASLARERGLLLAVDAISSEISEPLAPGANDIAVFTASSGKAIRGLPGLGIVVARRDFLEQLDASKIRSYYLNLAADYRIQHDRGEPRFAPAVSLHFCLYEALKELMEEGVARRRETIQRRTMRVRRRLSDMGLRLSIPEAFSANSVTSALLPAGVRFANFHRALRDRGFLVYSGSSVVEDCFQIGTGGVLTDEVLDEALDAVASVLAQHQHAEKLATGGTR